MGGRKGTDISSENDIFPTFPILHSEAQQYEYSGHTERLYVRRGEEYLRALKTVARKIHMSVKGAIRIRIHHHPAMSSHYQVELLHWRPVAARYQQQLF